MRKSVFTLRRTELALSTLALETAIAIRIVKVLLMFGNAFVIFLDLMYSRILESVVGTTQIHAA